MRSFLQDNYFPSLLMNSPHWDLFTKKEEYNSGKYDKHGRFLYEYSQYKNAVQPSVSESLLEKGFKVDYPDGKKFAIILSHDIDDVYVPLIHILASIANYPKNRESKQISKLINGRWDKKVSPYLNFKEIIDLERRYNSKSSFYFLAASRDPIRFRYNVECLSEELCNIVDQGWEVGLHVGYYSTYDPTSISNEKEKIEKLIGKRIIGTRNHFLRFNVPETWKNLSKLDILYDTSFGYADMIGFRNGICHPFKPYDLIENREINILEVPLNIMDGTLFDKMKLDIDRARDYVKSLIDTVEKNNGTLTILWHNTTFSNPYLKDWGKLYEFILKYGNSKNAWMTNGEELYKWWQHEY